MRQLIYEAAYLPASLTPFVGRRAELEAISEVFERGGSRLLTITGPGGVGKSRLAWEYARNSVERYPDRSWILNLAPLHRAAEVVDAIGELAGVPPGTGKDPVAHLAERLCDCQSLLLLDNFEHLMDAAGIISRLLWSTDYLRIIVTSRAPLHVYGENVISLRPFETGLASAGSHSEDGISAAVELFMGTAKSVNADFSLESDDLATIATICSLVDGLPLALELAAARIRHFSVQTLADRLLAGGGEATLDLLSGGPRDAPLRHQSLHDTIAWSYRLLSEDEQRLFRLISVFQNGFTLEAAESLLRGSHDRPMRALELVSGLVDASLLWQSQSRDDRFHMLESIRQFGIEQLRMLHEEEAARGQHAAYCQHLAAQAAEGFCGTQQSAWYARIEDERSNIEAAVNCLLVRGRHQDAIELIEHLHRFWFARSNPQQGRRLLERALAAGEDAGSTRANALCTAAALAALAEDFREASTLGKRALAIAQSINAKEIEGRILYTLGLSAEWSGDLDVAADLFERSISALSPTPENRFLAIAYWDLGTIYHWRGDYRKALELVSRGLELATPDDERGNALALSAMASVLLELGQQLDAATAFESALCRFEDLGDIRSIAGTIAAASNLALKRGGVRQAITLLSAAQAIGTSAGYARITHFREFERLVAVCRREVSSQEFEAHWDDGQRMPAGEAIHATREMLRNPGAITADKDVLARNRAIGQLTEREQEVLQLIAQGKSDREIADALFISYRTASKHVANILAKLNVPNRSRAAALLGPAGKRSSLSSRFDD